MFGNGCETVHNVFNIFTPPFRANILRQLISGVGTRRAMSLHGGEVPRNVHHDQNRTYLYFEVCDVERSADESIRQHARTRTSSEQTIRLIWMLLCIWEFRPSKEGPEFLGGVREKRWLFATVRGSRPVTHEKNTIDDLAPIYLSIKSSIMQTITSESGIPNERVRKTE